MILTSGGPISPETHLSLYRTKWGAAGIARAEIVVFIKGIDNTLPMAAKTDEAREHESREVVINQPSVGIYILRYNEAWCIMM